MRRHVSIQWLTDSRSRTPCVRGTGAALFALGLIAHGPAVCQNLLFLREFPLYSNPAAIALDATDIYTLRLTSQSAGNQTVSLMKLTSSGTEL